jgi:hypothetical protein
MVTKKQRNEMAFNELITDGGETPEGLILKVMRGKYGDGKGKGMTKAQRQRYEAALALLPYRLPRLNSIDAVNRNVAMTHEEWIKSLDGEGNEDDDQG